MWVMQSWGRLICFVVVGVGGACASAPKAWVVGWERPYHDLSSDGLEALVQVREKAQRSQFDEALKGLSVLIEAHPTNLDLLALHQDLLLLQAPSEASGLASAALIKAQREPRPETLILAARLAQNPQQAEALLSQAMVLDPDCADAHLGLASLALAGDSRYRWREARESLARCLALNPGHLGARRLEAWVFSQEGNPAAPAALARWLLASEGDPRVRASDRIDAALDLAALHLRAGHPERALEILDRLQGESHQRPRRLTLLAVARSESGDPDGALWAVSAAIHAAPGDSLPRVQEALLLAIQQPGGSDAEIQAWDRVIEVAGEGSELTDLIQGLRARVASSRRRLRSTGTQ